MRALVTGSAGHLGDALYRTLRSLGFEVRGLDLLPSSFTDHQGSLCDYNFVHHCLENIEVIFHTASMHKPHLATHSHHDFIDTNITGTLNLLRASASRGVGRFIFTSSTSVFGNAMIPSSTSPAVWVTEETAQLPKNIYGVTKSAAEDLCELFHRDRGLSCIILRTSRFFPEEDDNREMRKLYADQNLKANEFLFRRVDLTDVVKAHICAAGKASEIGFGKYIISATSPFVQSDLMNLRHDAPSVVSRLFPDYPEIFQQRQWRMFPAIDRVYVNEKARRELAWEPSYDFRHILELLRTGRDIRSELVRQVGIKGYHPVKFMDGPYPVK